MNDTTTIPLADVQREHRRAWLEERQAGIGSSDAPAIVGLGWSTAADVYASKITPVDDRQPQGPLRRGLELEGIVAAMYMERTGEPLTKPGRIFCHGSRPWQLASVDFARESDDRTVETKTTAGFGEGWGEPGTDEIPDAYMVQVQHQMGVMGRDWCDLAALDVIAWDLRVYRVRFDPRFFDTLTQIESLFWAHVEARKPLPSDWCQAPLVEVVKGKAVDLGPEVAALVAARRQLGDIEKEAKAEKERLTARIEALLGDADKATAGPWSIRRVNVKPCRVEAYDKPASSYIRCDLSKGATS